MMERKSLKIGQRIAHKGNNEYAGVIYTGAIIGFDRLAIYFQNDNGTRYWVNSWNLCTYPKTN
jgi:hypothetical protein